MREETKHGVVLVERGLREQTTQNGERQRASEEPPRLSSQQAASDAFRV